MGYFRSTPSKGCMAPLQGAARESRCQGFTAKPRDSNQEGDWEKCEASKDPEPETTASMTAASSQRMEFLAEYNKFTGQLIYWHAIHQLFGKHKALQQQHENKRINKLNAQGGAHEAKAQQQQQQLWQQPWEQNTTKMHWAHPGLSFLGLDSHVLTCLRDNKIRSRFFSWGFYCLPAMVFAANVLFFILSNWLSLQRLCCIWWSYGFMVVWFQGHMAHTHNLNQ